MWEKRPMKKTRILTVAACALAATALTVLGGPEPISSSSKEVKQVAPVQPACDYSWTGFYIGARAGGGWGDGESDSHLVNRVPGFDFELPGHNDLDDGGFIGGGEVGFNWQWHWLVLGAEADFSGSTISSDHSDIRDLGNPTNVTQAEVSVHQDLNWVGTVRGRLGFVPWCRLMIYGTGGFAYGQVDDSADVDFRNLGGSTHYPGSRDDTGTGFAAGGGVEYAINRDWSVKVEFLYIDLGDENQLVVQTPDLNSGADVTQHHWDAQFHTVTAGLNFKF